MRWEQSAASESKMSSAHITYTTQTHICVCVVILYTQTDRQTCSKFDHIAKCFTKYYFINKCP